MNISFHNVVAVGIAVVLTDTRTFQKKYQTIYPIAIAAFFIGIVCHAILDYMPHCYPVNSKVDAIIGLLTIVILTVLCKRPYRLILLLSFLGNIFPDIIDLSPQILNNYLNIHIPLKQHLFPWHWKEYSGSIFINDCSISTLNHIIIILTILTILWFRRVDLKELFGIKNN